MIFFFLFFFSVFFSSRRGGLLSCQKTDGHELAAVPSHMSLAATIWGVSRSLLAKLGEHSRSNAEKVGVICSNAKSLYSRQSRPA